jgi:hypothetical protein
MPGGQPDRRSVASNTQQDEKTYRMAEEMTFIANDFGLWLAPLHAERLDTRSMFPLVPSRNKASGWLHEELTRRIIGVCFEVSTELGAGFLENVYHKALLVALRDNGLDTQSAVPLKVHFRGQESGVIHC